MSMNPGNDENFKVYLEGSYVDNGLEQGANKVLDTISGVERKALAAQQRLIDAANKANLRQDASGQPKPFTGISDYAQWERASFKNRAQMQSGLPFNVFSERENVQDWGQKVNQEHAQRAKDANTQRQQKQQQDQEDKKKQFNQSSSPARDAAGRFVAGKADEQGERSFLVTLAKNIGSTRVTSAMGSAAGGAEGRLGVDLAQSFGRSLATSQGWRDAVQTLTQPLKSVVNNSILNGVLSKVPLGPLGGGMTMGEAGAVGVEAGGSAASGVLGAMPEAAAGAVSGVALGAALVGILALITNLSSAKNWTTDQGLRANIGGVGSKASADQLRNSLNATAGHYEYSPDQAAQLSDQLGFAGVKNKDMLGAVSETMAMARQTGQDPSKIGQLTATLMVQGGQSVSQVADIFTKLRQAADDTHVPINRLVDSLTTLETATGGATVNVGGLSALQATLGPSINAGKLMAPSMGSYGLSSIVQAGFLGMGVNQFAAIQGNAPALYSQVSKLAKNEFGTNDTAYNRRILSSQVQGMGLMDLSGLPRQIQDSLMSALISGNPDRVKKEQAQISQYDQQHPYGSNQWETDMHTLAQNETNILQQIANSLQQIYQKFGDLGDQIGKVFDAVGQVVNAIGTVAVDIINLPSLIGGWIIKGITDLINGLHLPGINIKEGTANSPGQYDQGYRSVKGGVFDTGASGDTFMGNPTKGKGAIKSTDASWFPTVQGVDTSNLRVENSHGQTISVPKWASQYAAQDSAKTGVPEAVLLAQLADESGFKNVSVPGKGYGVAQWDFSSAANVKNAEKYLGASSEAQAKQYAMDPRRAMAAEAAYMRDLQKGTGNWQSALGEYNGGPDWSTVPSSNEYAQQVYHSAIDLEVNVIQTGDKDAAKVRARQKKVHLDHTKAKKGERTHTNNTTAQKHHSTWGGFRANPPSYE